MRFLYRILSSGIRENPSTSFWSSGVKFNGSSVVDENNAEEEKEEVIFLTEDGRNGAVNASDVKLDNDEK